MRILYAATGNIAVPLLEALAAKGYIGAVLTAPDAPGKRGRVLLPSPVKEKAIELGIPVMQPETLRKDARAEAKSFCCDALMSFCYGKIFGPMFLAMFVRTFNVHPSLLPLHRGCSPIYAAIREGDRETGITVQAIAEGVDEGAVYGTLRLPLDGTETQESLEKRVSDEAPRFVLDLLGNLPEPKPQHGEPTYTGFISKEDGKIDFSRPASEIHALIRASYPWPKAYALLDGNPLYITGVHGSGFDSAEPSSEIPGTIVSMQKGKGLKVASGDGYIYISRVHPPMRKEMDAAAFANGYRDLQGKVLT